jgi:cytochrome P450
MLVSPTSIVSLPIRFNHLIIGQDIEKQTKTLIAKHKDKKGNTEIEDVVQQMLDSDMPEKEKNTNHLMLEVRTIVAAGTETSGNTLSVTIFHLVANPEKGLRLKNELLEAQKKNGGVPLTYDQLLKLPYLVCVLNNQTL